MEQADLLRYALDVLDTQSITYMVVGSLASGVYGEGRLTHDIDIVVELSTKHVDALCECFPAPDYYVSNTAARQAVERGGQFNVIHPASGNKIDFMIARRDEWGRLQLARRREEAILPDRIGYLASPEDTIIAKMWYYQQGEHEKHLRDIAAMIQVSGPLMDLDYVGIWAERLGFNDIWDKILARVRPQ